MGHKAEHPVDSTPGEVCERIGNVEGKTGEYMHRALQSLVEGTRLLRYVQRISRAILFGRFF